MTEKPQSEQSLDSRLDEALEMTFPASDLIAVDSPDPRSIHCIGALRVNRHIYLKAMRGDQPVPTLYQQVSRQHCRRLGKFAGNSKSPTALRL